MPFIDARLTMPVDPDRKQALKAAFGKAITTLHKTETYLMVQVQDSCQLWLGGKPLEKGAYLAVSLFGNAAPADYGAMTARLCRILAEQLDIPGDAVYVTYHPVTDWGWNGSNSCPGHPPH